jgi:hypothetical protein
LVRHKSRYECVPMPFGHLDQIGIQLGDALDGGDQIRSMHW